MLKPTLGFTILFVDNPKKSSYFYEKLFNMAPIETSLTFVMFALDNGVMLGLWSKHTAEPIVKGGVGGHEIAFAAEDVDAMYEALGNLDVTVLQKPTDMDFGRAFTICDPDGHRIRIHKLHER
ncbi:MAG: VOC family protein [Simkaniaceae bacterium]|nr:VOC family protein [Simkaniaceae bacterium]